MDGVLGGFGHLSSYDIRDSKSLLEKLMGKHINVRSGERLIAVDCGCGVGRISKDLLLHHFHEVDLVEPSQHLLEKAKNDLTKTKGLPTGHVVGRSYQCGLQDFRPEPQRYHCIWVQWCLLYLTDEDVLAFFDRAARSLREDGVIVVKENICKEGFVVDKDDSSLTRSNTYMLDLFRQANMQLLYNVKQKNFPKELFEVRMYVLKPRS